MIVSGSSSVPPLPRLQACHEQKDGYSVIWYEGGGGGVHWCKNFLVKHAWQFVASEFCWSRTVCTKKLH